MVTLFGYAVLAVFIGSYIIISSEKINRTGMALLGMGIVGFVFWGFYTLWDSGFYTDPAFTDPTNPELWHHGPFEALIGSIEWSTILFVTSMMIIVAVAGSSGMFQYLALRLAKPSNGDPRRLYITFLMFVFCISLFFDTVSTMLIMCPLTVEVCRALELDFKPFLISEAIVSNFSSIPSIVGAVPNLVIANAIPDSLNAGFLFLVFMPLSALLFIISLPIFLKWFDRSFGESDPHRVEALLNIHPEYMIKSKRDFYISVVAITILIIGFTLGQSISGPHHYGLAPAMFALAIGGFMLILSHDRAVEYLTNVGWDTVFFLVGLFGLVVALDITGLIDELADAIGVLLGGNAVLAIVFMVWIPALLSAFLDNLPVSIVLAPIAQQFASLSPVLPLALVFAVNIGGYIFTPLGSPANMVAIGFSEKEHDPIAFMEFVKIGTILGMIHLAIGTGWLLLASILLTTELGILLLFPLGIIPFVVGIYFLYFKPNNSSEQVPLLGRLSTP